MARIIVLNGTSSAGRSSVARAMQAFAPDVFLNFSIDSVLYALPEHILAKIMRGEPAPEIDYRSLVTGYYGCIRELAEAGNSLISDNAATTRWQTALLLDAVKEHDVTLVKVHCSVETAEAREAQRGDRRPGLARSQFENVHRWLDYDVAVDTELATPDANARIILEAAETKHHGVERSRARLLM